VRQRLFIFVCDNVFRPFLYKSKFNFNSFIQNYHSLSIKSIKSFELFVLFFSFVINQFRLSKIYNLKLFSEISKRLMINNRYSLGFHRALRLLSFKQVFLLITVRKSLFSIVLKFLRIFGAFSKIFIADIF